MWQDGRAALASFYVAKAKGVHNDVMHMQYLSPFRGLGNVAGEMLVHEV